MTQEGNAGQPAIRLQHVSRKFGDLLAVDDVTFEVNRGEIFAFLGPNGAGKTTTIKMLTTLLQPTSGTLRLDGCDPVTQATDVRKQIGVVFQDLSLDSELTAWENMDIHGVLYHVPRRIRRERAETLLKLFELWDRRDALVKTLLGRDAPTARDRARAAPHAEGVLSRRAHPRSRSAEPQSAVDACA